VPKRGVDVNTFTEYPDNDLYAAAYGGNTDIVGLLLEHGADINIEGVGGSPLQA
jgi:ankyrin repeat protein